MQTYLLKPADVERQWFLIDATDQTLGRLAAQIARLLMGKNRPNWTPWTDSGNFVVVLHVDKIHVTGKKRTDKVYTYYTGYPSGLVERTFEEIHARKPAQILQLAVRRMLPKSLQGKAQIKRLKAYAGAEHVHQAQNPQPYQLAN
jgi:large subunit ribosomal protein L13